MSDDEYCEFHDNGDGDGLVDDEDHHHHEEVFKVQTLCKRRGRWPDRSPPPPLPHAYRDEDNLDYNDYDDSLDAPLMRMSMICK